MNQAITKEFGQASCPAENCFGKQIQRWAGFAAGALACVVGLLSQAAVADEGGVSFWIPGFFGSLAAVPQQPGWSLATVNYHDNVSGAPIWRSHTSFGSATSPRTSRAM
jgi:hypothetical protein